ncbi:hypothetical protein Esti_002398 [Eimeria stiedai]
MPRLFCRRASNVDAALVCDLLRTAEGVQNHIGSAEPWYAACFECWGLAPPQQEELTTFFEDLLSSAFLCQLCEDSNGTLIGFMALGHSPILASSMGLSLQIPPLLADDPDVQEICNTRQNQWFNHWPQWLRNRHHCTKKIMNHPKQPSSLVGSAQSLSFGSHSDKSSNSSVLSMSPFHSTPSLSRGTSLEEEDTTSDISSETRLSNGGVIAPSNTLWLLLFICKSENQSSKDVASNNIDVARAMLQSLFASMYELEWVLQLSRNSTCALTNPTFFLCLNGLLNVCVRPHRTGAHCLDHLEELLLPLTESNLPPARSPLTLPGYAVLSNLSDLQVGHCRRQVLLPPLQARLAKMEDHDDLLAVFDGQTMLHSSVYGDYFIAELIGSQNEENRCIVSEVDGRARGFAAFTTQVDLALLANCFDLSAYDFLIKPSYHDKIKATVMAQHSVAAIGESEGGKLRNTRGLETLKKKCCLTGGFTSLINALKTEDGRISQAALLAAFQRVSRSEYTARAKSTQAGLWNESIETSNTLTAASILKALNVFSRLDINQLEADAIKVLDSWQAVAASIAAAHAVVRRSQRLQSRFSFVDPEAISRLSLVPADSNRSLKGHLPPSAKVSQPETAQRAGESISASMLITKLQEADTAALSKEETARVLLALHWWGGVPLDSMQASTSPTQLEKAFKQLSTTALRHFARIYDSKHCFQHLQQNHKNAFALNIFGMKQDLYSQALDLLLPAFSLFPDKEYMVVLRPSCSGSSAACPLLTYFQLVPRKSCSTLQHCLYILHRQSLMEPLFVQHITPKEWQEASSIAASVGVRLSEFNRSNTRTAQQIKLHKTSSNEASCGNRPDKGAMQSTKHQTGIACGASFAAHCEAFPVGIHSECSTSLCFLDVERRQEAQAVSSPQVLVCLSGERVIGLACVSEYNAKEVVALQRSHPLSPHTLHKSVKLQQQVRCLREKLRDEQRKKHRMQCRFDDLPPLPYEEFLDALEAQASQGNVLLDYFTINPIFTPLQSVILREVMRLTGSQLLHITVAAKDLLPTAAMTALPLLALPDISLRPSAFCPSNLDKSPVSSKDDSTCKSGISMEVSSWLAKSHILAGQQKCGLKCFSVAAQSSSHFIVSPSFLSVKPWLVTSRIVFVGSCETAISAIKHLIWGNPAIKFVDVTLVSSSGLPPVQRITHPRLHCYLTMKMLRLNCSVERRHLLFDLHVRVIKRSVVRIDRQKKRLYLSCALNSCFCPTDSSSPGNLSLEEHVDDSADAGERGKRSLTEEQALDGGYFNACGHSFLTYDLLVLTGGTHDSALQNVGIRSWGLRSCRKGCTRQHAALRSGSGNTDESVGQEYFGNRPLKVELRKVNGCVSAADPQIYELLGENGEVYIGPFLTPLRWNPLATVVVYGRSLDAFCLVQGLINRQVPPQKISLVLPPRRLHHGESVCEKSLHLPSAAADELTEVDEFLEEPAMGFQCLSLLHNLGIRVHTNLLLHDIVTESKGKLKGVLLVDVAALAGDGADPPQKQPPKVQCWAPGVPLSAYRSPEDTQQALRTAYRYISDAWDLPDDGHGLARSHSLTSLRSCESLEESTTMASAGLGTPSKSPVTSKPKLLPCRLLLTADRQSIDWDLLQAIHEAGLVYDGRLIVHHDFSTSDASIYAAGSLAEFHRRHRPTRATDLRHEKYCPDEVGFYLSIAIGRRLMPLWLQQTLPPLTDAFFARALLDPRLLRPSRDIVMLQSSITAPWRSPHSEDVTHYLHSLNSCTSSLERVCDGTCGNDKERMAQMPRFSAPLCRQGILPGNLIYCRLSACTGCLAKYTQCPTTAEEVDYVEIFGESCGKEAGGGNLNQLRVGATDEVRTDTLRLNWERPEYSGMNEHRTWQNLTSAEGQVCVIKWDALTRVRGFRYLGPRPLQLLGLQQLFSLPITFLNKITGKVQSGQVTDIISFLCEGESWANAMMEPAFLKFIREQVATLKENPEIRRAVRSRFESLKASNQRHERLNVSSNLPSCKEETSVESPGMAPVGASWSEQRKRVQLQLHVDAAENTLHPLLVHDVQRQLIDYLRQMQQEQDRYDVLHHYYIPSHATVESESKSRLERLAK